MLNTLTDAVLTGLPNVTAFVGIYLVFRIFSDFDLTVQGSLVTGAATTAVLLLHDVPYPWAMLAAVAAGGATGVVTTALHLALRIPVLLAGLVMSLALYSINLRILGQPTVALAGQPTVFSSVTSFGRSGDWQKIGIISA